MRPAAVLLLAPSLAAAQAPGQVEPTVRLTPPGMTPPAADIDEPPPGTPPPVDAPESTFRAPSLTAVAAPPAPAPTPLELAAARDSGADRAYGTSTALVVPDGKVDASLRGSPIGGMVSITAGLASGFEVSADAGGILGEDGIGSYGLGAKLALAHKGGWAFALQGSYHQLGDGGGSPIGLYAAGAVVSGCTDRDCTVLASLGGGALYSDEGSGHTVPYAWGSLVLGTGGFRPILEAAALQDGVLGFLGARMGGRYAALDLGVGLLAGGGGESGGLPMAALSVRP